MPTVPPSLLPTSTGTRSQPGGACSCDISPGLVVSDASDTTSTDVPSLDAAPLKAGTAAAEEAPRARHRTCADVAPAQVDTLVIKRLAAGLREAELLRLLEGRGPAAGAAISAKLLRGPNGSFSGTAFVRFATPEAALAALEELGTRPRLGGRRAHVESQKSKALLGGRELEVLLSEEELDAVRRELDRFLCDLEAKEAAMPTQLSSQQRKYAHSLAEQHGLGHSSRQGPGGETYVHLTKATTVFKHHRAAMDCSIAASENMLMRVARPPPGLDPDDASLPAKVP